MPAHCGKLWIAVENILDNERELGDEFPVLVGRNDLRFGDDLRKLLSGVLVKALFTVVLDPRKRFFVFVLVVDLELYTAKHLGKIHPFGAKSQIFLHEFRVAERTGNAHGNAADVDISLVFHLSDGKSCTGKA